MLLGCKVDHGKVEASIGDDMKAKGLALKSITCPADRKVKVGDKFDCTGEDASGKKLTWHVTQTEGGGAAWELEGHLVNQAAVGDSIEKKIDEKADVKCPAQTSVLGPGDSFLCDVDVGGKTIKVKIEDGAKADEYRWSLQGTLISQQEIGESMSKKLGATVAVTCPNKLTAVDAGDTFVCDLVVEDQKAKVKVTGGDHRFSWEILVATVLNQQTVGDNIEKQIHKSADVKCPAKVMIAKKGDTFTCDVDVQGRARKVNIVVGDNSTYTWKLR